MTRTVLAAAVAAVAAALAAAPAARAQTANVSPTSPSTASPGATMRTPPSGSTARPDPGVPQIGAPTPTERHYERRSEKAADSVCKGC